MAHEGLPIRVGLTELREAPRSSSSPHTRLQGGRRCQAVEGPSPGPTSATYVIQHWFLLCKWGVPQLPCRAVVRTLGHAQEFRALPLLPR